VLNEEHHVYLVQHTMTSKTYVKKIRSLYNQDVYKQLSEHPVVGVPRIHEFIEKDGNLFVFEEYISGTDLASLIKENGYLSEKDSVKYVAMLCDILIRLHSIEPPIIHRDIKPSNIMLTEDNRIILLDLNSAKNAVPGQKQDTVLLGTHGFAAPEQYGFGSSNIQTDLYAVGVLIKYLMGNADKETCSKNLAAIIEKCTRLEPDKRYSSAYELKEALLKCLEPQKRRRLPAIIVSCCVLITILTIVVIIQNKNNTSNIQPEDLHNNDNHNNPADSSSPTHVPSLSPTLSPSPTPTQIPSLSPTQAPSPSPTQTPSPSPTQVPSLSPTQAPSPSPTQVPSPTPTSTPVTPTEGAPVTVSSTPTPIPTITTLPVDDGLNLHSPVGTYEGDDHEKLVIADTGLAYYYCYDASYTEVECPWTLSNNIITISLSIMHCDISAEVKDDFSELIFRTDSLNWNTEVFQKISSNANDYILDPPPSPVKNVRVLSSGEKYIVYDNIGFTIPKQFAVFDHNQFVFPNKLLQTMISDESDFTFFLDSDIGNEDPADRFLAYIIAMQCIGNIDTVKQDPKEYAKSFMSSFLDSVQITYTENITIAGRESLLICVSGLLNSGYGGLSSNITTGYWVIIPTSDENNIICIQMLQRIGTKHNDDECFRYVLEHAVPIK
ncbi:MAG: protein kinase, partial [Lachnospiraceae bacterium]|nr:protein kinase [Lachnospiraceae bacterium]